MRVFLLPLTTRQALIYCQRATSKPVAQRTIFDRVSTKATETWAKWEEAEKGWQKQIVTYGNRALQRIPYQEWGLKSFPPTNAALQAEQVTDGKKFDVIYPANVMSKEDVPKVLARLAKERKQTHFNRFIGSMVAMPFSIPFALIPVIPNLPFFYLVYRCWSHWRALKGSDHLDFMIDHRLLRPISTEQVENLYRKHAPQMEDSFTFVTAGQVEDGADPTEQKIVPAGAHVEFASVLQVPELSGEVERAVWQVQRALDKDHTAKKQPDETTQSVTKDEKHE